MGKPTGFMEFGRELPQSKDPGKRIKDYKEIYLPFPEDKSNEQAARCMDCGTPFCHSGCPLGNNIPEFNDAVYQNNWKLAYEVLNSTNNFPEFTGRICPAPCEAACVLGINQPPVTIELIEKTIAEKAFDLGLIKPRIPEQRTGKKVAVIGSGPAGLGAAAQLNYAGHWVTVFERDDRIGGLLQYGIPDFKLEKWVVERRVKLMEMEEITFKANANVGENVSVKDLKKEFDAIILCGGSTIPFDLPIPGRELDGVHFAMDFLTQQNRRNAGDKLSKKDDILAKGKHVVVIGGGDTGSDCIGTSNRQGAKSILQIELLAKPPMERAEETPWPEWPMILRESSSQQEGCDREWALLTKEFLGDKKGKLKAIKTVEIEWKMPEEEGARPSFVERKGTEKEMPCELALLAIGYKHPQPGGMLDQFGVELDERGNVKCDNYKTSVNQVFAAGDMHRGQSLVVWAISEGREAAKEADAFLMGGSALESKDNSFLNTSHIND